MSECYSVKSKVVSNLHGKIPRIIEDICQKCAIKVLSKKDSPAYGRHPFYRSKLFDCFTEGDTNVVCCIKSEILSGRNVFGRH